MILIQRKTKNQNAKVKKTTLSDQRQPRHKAQKQFFLRISTKLKHQPYNIINHIHKITQINFAKKQNTSWRSRKTSASSINTLLLLTLSYILSHIFIYADEDPVLPHRAISHFHSLNQHLSFHQTPVISTTLQVEQCSTRHLCLVSFIYIYTAI